VSPGERYRFRSATGIRVTTARLEPADAPALADDIGSLGPGAGRDVCRMTGDSPRTFRVTPV
jgi:hypothetical protein